MKCLADQLFLQLSPSNTTWNSHMTAWRHDSILSEPFRLIISLLLMISNTMMMIGMWKTKNRKMSIPKKMYFSSAICGLVTGLTLLFYTLSMLGVDNRCMYERISDMVLTIVLFLDYAKLLSIGIVRFISFKWPFKRLVTGKVILIFWFTEITFACVSWFFDENIERKEKVSAVKMYLKFMKITGLTSFAYILLTLILTFMLCIVLDEKNPAIQSNATYVADRIMAKKRKAVKRLVALGTIYVICNLPLSVMCFIVHGTSEMEYIKNPMLLSRRLITVDWFYSIFTLYSVLNSCIYMWMDKKIVLVYKTCYKKRATNRSLSFCGNFESIELQSNR